MSKLLCVVGPTASGKTALAVALAKELNGEVVSSDSMQLYRGMDIGTAKPTADEMQGVPHHMLDMCDPWESYSVARYVQEADEAVGDILRRGKLPIIAGGTGLYMDALINGREFSPVQSDLAIRRELEQTAEKFGIEPVREILRINDPDSYARLHPNDQKRIIRAAEVFLATGKTITAHNTETAALPPKYETVKIGLNFADRTRLYSRIDRRVNAMVEAGLPDEVRRLLPLCSGSTAMQAIGYKEFADYIRGQCDLNDAVEAVKQESRRYAKRQLTWLRRDPDIHWLELSEPVELQAMVNRAMSLWKEFS